VSVGFPAYRQYSNARIEVNDAMMALLIGARLGEHALSTSAASPDVRLPTLFGQIASIRRFNRTAGDAARLLGTAEVHLAYMAIPYVLAVHSTLIESVAQMVRDDGKDEAGTFEIKRVSDLSKLSLSNGHEYIVERCGRSLDTDLLPLFHLTRAIRNQIVHAGGNCGSRLPRVYRALPPRSEASWENLAGRSLSDAMASGRLDLREGELVAVLAVSHYTARALNDLIAGTLSREYWARLAVEDYRRAHPDRYGPQATRLRRLKGHTRQHYRRLGLTDAELLAATKE
jgi:hypothetical protein